MDGGQRKKEVMAMTIYIAGKMSGLPDYNRKLFFETEEMLRGRGWRVLNPAKIGDLPGEELCWPINRAMIDGADAIYLLEGWEYSPGALREYAYAYWKGLEIVAADEEEAGMQKYEKCPDCGGLSARESVGQVVELWYKCLDCGSLWQHERAWVPSRASTRGSTRLERAETGQVGMFEEGEGE